MLRREICQCGANLQLQTDYDSALHICKDCSDYINQDISWFKSRVDILHQKNREKICQWNKENMVKRKIIQAIKILRNGDQNDKDY